MLLTKSALSILIGFLFSILISLIIIPYLKKKKIDQSLSEYLRDTHSTKNGTPTMGGIIFILSTIMSFLYFYLTKKITISYNLLIVIFTFIGYGIIGFIDDYLIIKRRNNIGLSEHQKLLGQIIIATIFFLLFMKAKNEPLLWIHSMHLKLDIGFFYGIFILFVLVSTSNAVNITDGLDGLATGLSIICLFVFSIITLNTGWLEGYSDISLFINSLVGSLLGFLIFNVNPAKIFMGDTGSLALGGIIGSIAILTRREILLIIIGIVFVIETLSCLIQRYYYKLTKKRLFKMAPLHHSFEKTGWNERDIVKLFWSIGLIGGMLGIIYGIYF